MTTPHTVTYVQGTLCATKIGCQKFSTPYTRTGTGIGLSS